MSDTKQNCSLPGTTTTAAAHWNFTHFPQPVPHLIYSGHDLSMESNIPLAGLIQPSWLWPLPGCEINPILAENRTPFKKYKPRLFFPHSTETPICCLLFLSLCKQLSPYYFCFFPQSFPPESQNQYLGLCLGPSWTAGMCCTVIKARPELLRSSWLKHCPLMG